MHLLTFTMIIILIIQLIPILRQIIILKLNWDQIMNYLNSNYVNIIYYNLKKENQIIPHFLNSNKIKTLNKIHFK